MSEYRKKINQISESQIFFVGRLDMGTFIYLIQYVKCWEKARSKSVLVILTSKYKMVEALAKKIIPNTILISPNSFFVRLMVRLFGHGNINKMIFFDAYRKLHFDYPNAIHLFEPALRPSYISFFDERMKTVNSSVSISFIEAYKDVRKILNYNERSMVDVFHLHEQFGYKKNEKFKNVTLEKSLGIKKPYVVLNLNCKKYHEKKVNHRSIHSYLRYESLIDYLIEKEFSVVLQGRNEQPPFRPRKGFIDYTRSGLCSIENDLSLYSACSFAIVNKTGPELFCSICNVPQLGLNYSELCSMTPNVKLRFYHKHVRDKKLDRFLTWKELLASPAYFHIGANVYDQDFEFYDLDEEEMIEALSEFLLIFSQEDEKWLNYTEKQKEFRSILNPLHLNLYDTKSVPCDTYLNKEC